MSQVNRKSHILQREKSLAIPRHIIFFDTETEQVTLDDGTTEHKLKLGWACYYRRSFGRHLTKTEWFYFTEPLQFWQFVLSHLAKKTKVWVIARNIVFDFTVCQGFRHLHGLGFKLKFFHNAGVTTIISIKSRYGSLLFVDSMNWFRESLEKTGKRIGLPKYKIDFATCSVPELKEYCRRDVEIELENFKLFVKFLVDNGISRLCYTIGSTAMAAFLFGHYRHKIYIHNNQQAIDLERDSYRGGRVECFFLGEKNNENYYVLDVNSLYPSVMLNRYYPAKYKRITGKMSLAALQECLKNKSVVAKALIKTPEPAYAVKKDRTIFPVGRFWVTLTSPELKYALRHNHLVKVDKAVIYYQERLFDTFVKRFYKLRQKCDSQGDKEYAEICKLILNSLYGKFGQKADVWKKIGESPGEFDRVEVLYKRGENNPGQIRYLLGEIFELQGYEESFDSFPAISSHVTAYGRLRLWYLMKKAGHGNYYYCDTDSLIVNQEGLCHLKNLIHQKHLGKLKEVEVTKTLTIRGLKDYSTEQKLVVKGIRKNAIKIRDGVYEQEQWPSFRGTFRSGNVNRYTTKTVTKVLTRKYTKGIVNQDGSVEPFVLADADFQSLWL